MCLPAWMKCKMKEAAYLSVFFTCTTVCFAEHILYLYHIKYWLNYENITCFTVSCHVLLPGPKVIIHHTREEGQAQVQPCESPLCWGGGSQWTLSGECENILLLCYSYTKNFTHPSLQCYHYQHHFVWDIEDSIYTQSASGYIIKIMTSDRGPLL